MTITVKPRSEVLSNLSKELIEELEPLLGVGHKAYAAKKLRDAFEFIDKLEKGPEVIVDNLVPTPSQEVFWMVWLEGRGAPSKKHGSLEKAKAEAARLAQANGCKAYILRPIAAQIPNVHYEEIP